MDEPTVFQPVDPTKIQWNGFVGTVNYAAGNKHPIFYARSVHNPAKSKEAGAPVFDSHDYVKIMTPGERLEIPDRPVREEDKARWPIQWMQYQKNQEQVPEGIPVALLFPTHPEISDTLRANGIHTVEQLANLSASATEALMGGQMWKNQAHAYLEQANKGVGFHQFQKEREEKDSQIRVLNQTVDMLKAEMNKLQSIINSSMMGTSNQMAMQAGMMGGRPQYPNPQQAMQEAYKTPHGQVPLSQNFDSQTAQINATNRQTRSADKVAHPANLNPNGPPAYQPQGPAQVQQVLPDAPYAQPPASPVFNPTAFQQMSEQPRQRKERSDKGKVRGSYKDKPAA